MALVCCMRTGSNLILAAVLYSLHVLAVGNGRWGLWENEAVLYTGWRRTDRHISHLNIAPA
jgi:hypothetical protein